MRNFSIRLFTLTICATALLTAPMILSVNAAGNGVRDVEKTRKKTQRSESESDDLRVGSGDLRSPTGTWPPPIYNDFDRKAGGGGGM